MLWRVFQIIFESLDDITQTREETHQTFTFLQKIQVLQSCIGEMTQNSAFVLQEQHSMQLISRQVGGMGVYESTIYELDTSLAGTGHEEVDDALSVAQSLHIALISSFTKAINLFLQKEALKRLRTLYSYCLVCIQEAICLGRDSNISPKKRKESPKEVSGVEIARNFSIHSLHLTSHENWCSVIGASARFNLKDQMREIVFVSSQYGVDRISSLPSSLFNFLQIFQSLGRNGKNGVFHDILAFYEMEMEILPTLPNFGAEGNEDISASLSLSPPFVEVTVSLVTKPGDGVSTTAHLPGCKYLLQICKKVSTSATNGDGSFLQLHADASQTEETNSSSSSDQMEALCQACFSSIEVWVAGLELPYLALPSISLGFSKNLGTERYGSGNLNPDVLTSQDDLEDGKKALSQYLTEKKRQTSEAMMTAFNLVTGLSTYHSLLEQVLLWRSTITEPLLFWDSSTILQCLAARHAAQTWYGRLQDLFQNDSPKLLFGTVVLNLTQIVEEFLEKFQRLDKIFYETLQSTLHQNVETCTRTLQELVPRFHVFIDAGNLLSVLTPQIETWIENGAGWQSHEKSSSKTSHLLSHFISNIETVLSNVRKANAYLSVES